MPLALTGASIISFVGVKVPSPDEIAWADACASAVLAGITTRLNGAVIDDISIANEELNVAALIAGAECYKRREATFGITGYADMEGAAIRVARDYLAGVAPMIDRYGNGPGIG